MRRVGNRISRSCSRSLGCSFGSSRISVTTRTRLRIRTRWEVCSVSQWLPGYTSPTRPDIRGAQSDIAMLMPKLVNGNVAVLPDLPACLTGWADGASYY